MTLTEYNSKYKTLRKLGKALVPMKEMFMVFQDGLQKLGFESVAPSTRQKGAVSVSIINDTDNGEDDYKAVISRYGKEVSRITIFPTAEDFIRLGIEIAKAENSLEWIKAKLYKRQ